jgi:hypothetical protein
MAIATPRPIATRARFRSRAVVLVPTNRGGSLACARVRLRDHPFIRVLAITTIAWIGVELFIPETAARLAWPEESGGLVEHASNVLIIIDLLLWAAVAIACVRRRRAFILASAFTFYLLFATMEELDYGRVWGVNLGYEVVARYANGRVNFHDSRWHSMALPLVFLPAVLFFLVGLVPALRSRWERFAPASPTRVESHAFLATGAVTAILETARITAHRLDHAVFTPNGRPFRPSPLGFCQCEFYVLFAFAAWRALRESREW